MRQGLRPRTVLVTSVVVAFLVLAALTLLPHSTYIRFQQLSRESRHYLRVQWIYERIHFDPTPIHVAFIGTSHTQSGINSHLVEQELAKHQRPAHVVNFAVPHLGRDIEYLVVRELLEHRRIDTLVLEVQALEARAAHPAFQRLANTMDIATAPVLINSGLIDNWARLPLRQLQLAVKTIRPEAFDLNSAFDPARYEGAHFDDTLVAHGTTQERTRVSPYAYFGRELDAINKEIRYKNAQAERFTLPGGGKLLYRYTDHYLNAILDLAKKHRVKVVFLYIPHLGARDVPERTDWMANQGPLLVPKAVIHDAVLWQNASHLNYYGALALSRWTAAQLAAPASL